MPAKLEFLMRVLFLDLDTLRPDHLGCGGYHRGTSPNIDRIAGEGVRFDNDFQRLRDTGRGQWIDTIIERHPEFSAAL